MTVQYNLYEAKTKLSELVDKAAQGEEIVICKAGKPLARLGPLPEKRKEPRKGGLLKGKIWIADDFDDPLPDDVIESFYSSETDYLFDISKDKS
ncbi:MAG: type II toxin-antitoxin system Phd/YefM family antitoxin [Alphaproteobacteria bacterium]